MAVTLSTKARNASVDARRILPDEGTGAGKVKVLTSADAVLATFTMSDPCFGASSAGTATASSLPKTTTATGTGTAAKYIVTDSDDEQMWGGTCGTSGTDMIIDNTSIVTGQTVNLTAWTHSQPA